VNPDFRFLARNIVRTLEKGKSVSLWEMAENHIRQKRSPSRVTRFQPRQPKHCREKIVKNRHILIGFLIFVIFLRFSDQSACHSRGRKSKIDRAALIFLLQTVPRPDSNRPCLQIGSFQTSGSEPISLPTSCSDA
jgi:hypothetical protein